MAVLLENGRRSDAENRRKNKKARNVRKSRKFNEVRKVHTGIFSGKKRMSGAGRRRVHRQAKDRLFRFLFEKDREALLQFSFTVS